MGEERVLVLEQVVQAAVERVVLRVAFIHAEQIGERSGAKPVPVQPPFTAGRKEPVEREQTQDFLPVGAFATAPQARGEEGVQLQVAPELVAQPAGAPGAGPGELQLVEPHLHGGGVAGLGRPILREQGALPGLALLFVEDFDGLLPGGALRVVDLAQVEDVALHDRASDATALDNGPGAMVLAVLLAHAAFEKHEASMAKTGREGRGWVATTRPLETAAVKTPANHPGHSGHPAKIVKTRPQ